MKKAKAGIIIIGIIIMGCIGMSTEVCCAKTSYVAVYKLKGKKVTYRNTKILKVSENSVPIGKKKKLKFAKNVSYYWFCNKKDGSLGYKKISSKIFKKRVKEQASGGMYQVCKVVIKSGKIKRIYGEYQA